MNKHQRKPKGERILNAGIIAFGKSGYSGFGLNGFLEKEKISKGKFYHYFSGKEDLYHQCVERCFQHFMEELDFSQGNFSFDTYCEKRMNHLQKYPEEGAVIFEALLNPPSEEDPLLQKLMENYEEFNKKLFLELRKEGDLREGIDEDRAMEWFLLLQKMYNSLFFATSPARRKEKAKDHEDMLKFALDHLLYGILREKGTGK